MISKLAYVHPDAKIGGNVTIEPFAYVAGDVVIGDDCWIGPGAVINDGARIGKIKEVLDYPGNSVYVVQGEREYLIPAVKEFILSTDLERNQMQVKLLKGMASDED